MWIFALDRLGAVDRRYREKAIALVRVIQHARVATVEQGAKLTVDRAPAAARRGPPPMLNTTEPAGDTLDADPLVTVGLALGGVGGEVRRLAVEGPSHEPCCRQPRWKCPRRQPYSVHSVTGRMILPGTTTRNARDQT
jgi:hypothetical protein